jgi:hypothetical protein
MQLPPGLRHILAETKLFTDAKDYVILRLPITEAAMAAELIATIKQPFVGMTRDKDEITLVLPREIWEEQSPVIEVFEESPDYNLITFDLPLDLGLVGYFAVLANAVAEAGVSIFPISSFSRDHIFVPVEDFDRAWNALRELIHRCQIEEAAETGE